MRCCRGKSFSSPTAKDATQQNWIKPWFQMLLLLFLQISFYVKVGKFSIKIDFLQSLRGAKKVIIIFGCCGSIYFPSPASNPFWTILRGNLEAFLWPRISNAEMSFGVNQRSLKASHFIGHKNDGKSFWQYGQSDWMLRPGCHLHSSVGDWRSAQRMTWFKPSLLSLPSFINGFEVS